MDYAGFYINLDRNPERRAAIEAELARCGLSGYARFRASDGNSLKLPNPHLKEGEMGCFTSHHLLLKENAAAGKHLHVIEDDILLSPSTGPALQWASAQGKFDAYDIIYTDVFVPLLNDAYKAYKAFYDATVKRDAAGNIERVNFTVIDMKELIFASTCSYIVSKKALRKLSDLYAAEIAASPALPIDLFIRKKTQEGALKTGCIFPFVTSIKLESILETNMGDRQDRLSALASSIARHSFFVGCDWDKCRKYAQELLPPPPASDGHAALLTHLLGFSLTDKYRLF